MATRIMHRRRTRFWPRTVSGPSTGTPNECGGLRWTRNFDFSAHLVKVTGNRRRQPGRRRMMAIRGTGSIPNFA